MEAIARPQCSLPVEAKEIRGEDEAQFDCSARARFPQLVDLFTDRFCMASVIFFYKSEKPNNFVSEQVSELHTSVVVLFVLCLGV